MCNTPIKYKFVYLSFFAINTILVIAALIMQWYELNIPQTKSFVDSMICFWGIGMFLFLWGNSFIVTPTYSGKKMLNGHITRIFVFSLIIIEAAVLYVSMYHHRNLLIPATILMAIWIITFSCTLMIRKRFIISRQ